MIWKESKSFKLKRTLILTTGYGWQVCQQISSLCQYSKAELKLQMSHQKVFWLE